MRRLCRTCLAVGRQPFTRSLTSQTLPTHSAVSRNVIARRTRGARISWRRRCEGAQHHRLRPLNPFDLLSPFAARNARRAAIMSQASVADGGTSRQNLASIRASVSSSAPTSSAAGAQRNSQEGDLCRQKRVSRHNCPDGGEALVAAK
jgi:hypothetical protein